MDSLSLKRPFIWLRRFRHRRGYGVHSPFAFGFITDVVYEKTPYYKYEELAAQSLCSRLPREPARVLRLLFRLVNYAQPRTLVDAGPETAASLYLKAGKEACRYIRMDEADKLPLAGNVAVDFLYLHHPHRTDFVREAFDVCASRVTPRSLFVIDGIHRSRDMAALWRQIQQDKRTGITFDLYDLGILFFDKRMNKQDYIVNF